MPKSKRSKTPFGLTMPSALRRLGEVKGAVAEKDSETIMAKAWEKVNTPDSSINGGRVPIQIILHECGPECGKRKGHYPSDDGHRYNEISERDIKVASSIVQWLATNMGRSFYQEYLKEFEKRNRTETV